MAFDPTGDIRAALTEIGDPVTLTDAGGAVVYGWPSIATPDDSMDGDSIVPGKTKVLRFATSDVPTVIAGMLVNWQAKSYRVIKAQLASNGVVTRLFIGAP